MKNAVTVAYLGPSGTYSEIAAKKMHKKMELIPEMRESIPGVIHAAVNGEANAAVVPIRTHNGDVQLTLDTLVDINLSQPRLWITGYGDMPIPFYLAARPGTKLAEVTVVSSKKEAIDACAADLEKLIPGYQAEHVSSTAYGASKVAKTPNVGYARAALCGEDTMKENGLEPLLEEPIMRETSFMRLARTKYDSNKGRAVQSALMIASFNDHEGQLHAITGAIRPYNMEDISLLKNRKDGYGRTARTVFVVRISATERDNDYIVRALEAEVGKERRTHRGEKGYNAPWVLRLGSYPKIDLK
jgi:prephenate dehydratase